MVMVPEELRKWVDVASKITSGTAIILFAAYLIWHNTGERNEALYAAKASAEEAVAVSRLSRSVLENHAKLSGEDAAVLRMLLTQICVNTARGNREAVNQCLNYYR